VKRCIYPIVTLYSLAAPYKGGRCKQCAIIFHRGRVVVNFVQKFVAMATRVGRGETQMTPSPLAVVQNFAIFEWLLWQQWSIGGKFK